MRALRIFAFVISFGLLAVLPAAGAAGTPGAHGVPPGARVATHQETGKVRFIGSAPGRPIPRPTSVGASASPLAIARAFLDRYGRDFGIRDQAKELRVMSTSPAPSGRSVVRFQQVFGKVPVLGGELVVNLDADGDVLSASGEALPAPGISVDPQVTASEARRAAIASVAGKRGAGAAGLDATAPTLWIHDSRLLGGPGLDVPTLVWRMDVRGEGPTDELVLVDARLGNVVVRIDQIHEARDRRVCDANSTSAHYPCTSPVRTELDPPHSVTDVNNAFDFSGDTYDFFFDNFGRDSLDDAGMPLLSTVRFCPSPSICPYQNAFWDGAQMVYGAGFAVDDVVGHELTHGVTEFTSHLFYYYQSGAINESLSDVLGEFVDLTNGAGNDDPSVRWLLGEDIPGIGAIRDMEDPPAFGDPDRMTSPNYTADVNETDGGGVHTNSGVNNKAAFLITDGGTFNGQTVTGLGITKAAHLYYEVATNHLTSASDYADLATGLLQACDILDGGPTGITPADCDELRKAVLAVEMDQPPPAAPNAEAPVCPTGQSPANLFFDDLENTSSGNWALQTLAGSNEWYYPQNSHPYAFDATYATSGVTNFWGYNRSAISDYAIRMTGDVTLPAAAFLHFNHAYGFEDDVNGSYDGGVLEYSTNGGTTWTDAGSLFTHGGYTGTIASGFGNPMAMRSAFVRESNGYISSRADLSSLAGQNVRIRFRIGTDSILDDFGWFVDDIRIYTCAAGGDTDPPQTTITSGPSGATDDATPTFGFTSDEPGSTFECRVDSDPFAACTSPHTTSTLAEGPHTFEVKATDSSANEDPTPAARSFTVVPPPPPPPPPPASVPSVSIGNAKKKEADTGKKPMKFKVTLSGAATAPVTVSFATKNGTAKASKDYKKASGTLTFPAGTTSLVVKVMIKGDTLDERNEKFKVLLSAPGGATIADGSAIGKIMDND